MGPCTHTLLLTSKQHHFRVKPADCRPWLPELVTSHFAVHPQPHTLKFCLLPPPASAHWVKLWQGTNPECWAILQEALQD